MVIRFAKYDDGDPTPQECNLSLAATCMQRSLLGWFGEGTAHRGDSRAASGPRGVPGWMLISFAGQYSDSDGPGTAWTSFCPLLLEGID